MNYLFSPSAIKIWVLVGAFLLIVFFFALVYAFLRFRQSMTRQEEFQSTGPLLNSESVALSAFQTTIRDLKQQQQELERKARLSSEKANSAEALTRLLVENIAAPVLVINRLGLVQNASPAARKFFEAESLTAFGLNDLFDSSFIESDQQSEIAEVSVSELLREALHATEPLKDVRILCETRRGNRVLADVSVLPHPEHSIILLTVVPGAICTDVVPPVAENLSEDGTEQR